MALHTARRALIGAAGALVFGALVTANSAGYRFGAGDQAFYVPAIERALDPGLFPRDRALVDAQAGWLWLDEGAAWLVRATGVGLPALLFAGYVLSVALVAAGLWLMGRGLAFTAPTTVAFCAAMTLRHRVARTGVNTFEGIFHPRVLAFGLGLVAVGALLHRRRAVAVAAVACAAVVHPTTALWFALWIATAIAVADTRVPAWLPAACAVAGGVGLWLLAGAGLVPFERMDDAWLSVLAEKDYLFPSRWPPDAWLTGTLPAVVTLAVYRWRVRRALAVRLEQGLVAGLMLLVAVLVGTLPLVEDRVAWFVQLQIPRALWLVEVAATAYLVWWLAEAGRQGQRATWWRPLALAASLAAAGLARGAYVMLAGHPGRPLVALDLAPGPWREVGAWAARATPSGAYFLADPGHAWRYGLSFRVTARRDVLVEGVKDAAIAMYSGAVAARVGDRIQAVGDFSALTPERVRALARRYGLDYLVDTREFPFPVVHRAGPFVVYAIRDAPPR